MAIRIYPWKLSEQTDTPPTDILQPEQDPSQMKSYWMGKLALLKAEQEENCGSRTEYWENPPPSMVRQIPPEQETQLRVTVLSQRVRPISRQASATILSIKNVLIRIN